MAYTKTPTSDTYSQEDIQLVKEWTSRQGDITGAKDEQVINCFVEQAKNKNLQDSRVFQYKRGGSSLQHTPVVSGNVRGAFYWKDKTLLCYAIGRNVYMKNLASGALITCTNVFTSTTGYVGFESFQFEASVIWLLTTDGTDYCQITDTGTMTPVVDPDLPVPHLPYIVVLDGYVFLAKANSGQIFNSDNNDPASWSPTNFITTEIESDIVRYIAKLNNYLVAFGSSTIEYFYDAANATDSPLGRNATPIKNALFTGGYAKNGNDIYFVGTRNNDQLDVFKLSDFNLETIGSPTISRYLSGAGLTLANIVGNIVFSLGHTFYVLNAGSVTTVYDLETKYWARWAWKANANFDITNSVTIESTTANYSLFTIGTGAPFYKLDDSVYQDDGTNFTVTMTTDPVDFGTLNRKYMPKAAIMCDTPPSNSSAYLSWSDDDYQSFSTPRAINLNQDLPSITRLGSFRQRAFKLTYTDNYPFRVQQLQVNINKARN